MNKEHQLSKAIERHIGGLTNAEKIYNCMTRVRIDIKDWSKVDIEGLKRTKDVLGAVENGDTLQVIVGPGLSTKVADEMNRMAGLPTESSIHENLDPELNTSVIDTKQVAQNNKQQFKEKQKDTGFKKFTRIIASIFVPLIPAFVGAGIIGGIASIFQNLITAERIDAQTWGQIVLVLNIIKSGLFAYLNIYVGINAAKVFRATEGLGGIVAGIVYLTGMTPEAPLMNIFNGQPLAPGQGGIIGLF